MTFEEWWDEKDLAEVIALDNSRAVDVAEIAFNAGRNAGLTEAIEASAAKKNIGPFTDEDGTKYYRVGGIDDAIDAIRAKLSDEMDLNSELTAKIERLDAKWRDYESAMVAWRESKQAADVVIDELRAKLNLYEGRTICDGCSETAKRLKAAEEKNTRLMEKLNGK